MRFVWFLFLLTGCITGFTFNIPEETGTIEVFFCDQVDCLSIFNDRMRNSDCAMYHVDSEFKAKRLVVDGDHPVSDAVVEDGFGLMHNKFCVKDDKVWTGSWNPSQGMSIPNNALLIQSNTIASAFQHEFNELHKGIFHGGKSRPGLVKLNGNFVEAYFCPEDNCQDHVIDTLSSAKKYIHFMTFAFTDDLIGNLLVEKIKEGVEVRGIFDPRKNKYSEFEKLKEVSTVKKVHHKVFIIDGKTVVTGSYNPTKNGNTRNDENVIIIHDVEIAKLFEEEFERLI